MKRMVLILSLLLVMMLGAAAAKDTTTHAADENYNDQPKISSGITEALQGRLLVAGLSVMLVLGAVYLLRWNNVVIYIADKDKYDYKRVGAQHISKQHPAIDLRQLKEYPSDEVAVEIKRRAANQLVGRQVPILFREFHAFCFIDRADQDYWATYSVHDLDNIDDEN